MENNICCDVRYGERDMYPWRQGGDMKERVKMRKEKEKVKQKVFKLERWGERVNRLGERHQEADERGLGCRKERMTGREEKR